MSEQNQLKNCLLSLALKSCCTMPARIRQPLVKMI